MLQRMVLIQTILAYLASLLQDLLQELSVKIQHVWMHLSIKGKYTRVQIPPIYSLHLIHYNQY